MQSLQKVYGWCVANRNDTDPDNWPVCWEDYEVEASPEDGGVGTIHPVKGKQIVAKLFKQHVLENFQQDDNMTKRLVALGRG
jgi:hypothetical protein